ncbi:hypothetical protein [Myroides sp. DW712]|uniref:hypothetical protein n=1 Tax=Myroides sp. DW712 TaxID=3389800 RepID=UPI00397A9EE0
MQLALFQIVYIEDFQKFIDFWSALYSYPQEEEYECLIQKKTFVEADLICLFTWKNGMKLSTKKRQTLQEKILCKLSLIQQFKGEGFDIEDFKIAFGSLSAVWQLFLLHCINPVEYPMYDQHIHRAFCKIHKQAYHHITDRISEKSKLAFYYKEYLGFVKEHKEFDLRKIDKALFTYGRFLKTNLATKGYV